jgi:hypothetical protein
LDLISAVEELFRELASQLRQASAKLDVHRQRGIANEDWLVIALRPGRKESAAIHVDVLTDQIVFGVGDHGCRIDLEIGGQLSPQEALRELRQLASAVVDGGYSEVVKEIPLAGKHVEGILKVDQKTIHLRCGVPLGNKLPGRSSLIHYQRYDEPTAPGN